MRILIVDDHKLFREGLASLLQRKRDMEVVGEAGNAHDAIEAVCQTRPDVVLMDFELPDGTGAYATHVILSNYPETKIVFLTMHDEDDRLLAAVRSGASGYLLKTLPVDKLVNAIRSLENKQAAISREMTAKILYELSHPTPYPEIEPDGIEPLTTRELEVLNALSEEMSNQQIAMRLVISENTVKNHVHHILTKLSLNSRHDAARYGRRHGMGKFLNPD